MKKDEILQKNYEKIYNILPEYIRQDMTRNDEKKSIDLETVFNNVFYLISIGIRYVTFSMYVGVKGPKIMLSLAIRDVKNIPSFWINSLNKDKDIIKNLNTIA
jgi:hypothetical protein